MSILKNLYIIATTAYWAINSFRPDFNTLLIQQMSDPNSTLMQQISDPNSILMQRILTLNTSQLFKSLNITSDPDTSFMQRISTLNTSQLFESLGTLLENTQEEKYSSIKIIKEATESLKHIDKLNMAQKGRYRDALNSITEFLSNTMHLTKTEIIRALQSNDTPLTPEQILSKLEVTAESLKNSIKLEEEKILQSQEKIKNLTKALQHLEKTNSQSQTFSGKVLDERNQPQQSNNPDL